MYGKSVGIVQCVGHHIDGLCCRSVRYVNVKILVVRLIVSLKISEV